MSAPSGLMAEGNSPPESDTDISLALGSLETGMDIHAFRRVRMAISAWLAEARASAEPRLRPVSEKPERDSVIACKYNDGRWHHFPWRGGEVFDARVTGWVLLDRAKPKTLAEQAREILRECTDPCDDEGRVVFWERTRALLHRIAEQEKHDE